MVQSEQVGPGTQERRPRPEKLPLLGGLGILSQDSDLPLDF